MDKYLIKSSVESKQSAKLKGQRKALSPLQIGNDEKTLLTNREFVAEKSKNENASYKRIGTKNVMAAIDENSFCETSAARTSTVGMQTDELKCLCNCHESLPASEAKVKDCHPPGYWKALAEDRRIALSEALTENKKLHEELNELTLDVEALAELAKYTHCFAEHLKKFADDSGIVADQSLESESLGVQ